MAELLKPDVYRRLFSLFKNSHYTQPAVYPIARLQIPKSSLLHYTNFDGVSFGPQSSDPLLRKVPGVVYVDHITNLIEPMGTPIKIPGSNKDLMITDYRRNNRAIRPLKLLSRLDGDLRAQPVINYALLPHLVRYPANFRAGQYAWSNNFKTVWSTINKISSETNRNHFIEIELPDSIPSLTKLNEIRDNPGSQSIKALRTDEERFIADLYIWAGHKRENSVLSNLDESLYSRVNLILRRLDSWIVINLGWLDKFRKSDSNKIGLDPKQHAIRVLYLITKIHQAAAPIETKTSEEVQVEPEVTSDTFDKFGQDLDKDEEDLISTEEILEDAEAEISLLEKELEELDKLKEESLQRYETIDEDGNVVTSESPAAVIATTTPEMGEVVMEGTAFLNKANDLASNGLLSGAEYRRLQRLAEKSKTLEDPYGNGKSLDEFVKITNEDIEITATKHNDDEIVLDQSLKHATIDEFNRKYVKDVMRKDLVACVKSIQKAPLVITDYRVERTTDAMNDYETHVVKIVPVVGSPSTVKINVPVVDENGTFRYNGNQYRMKNQRVDLPIRKISPTRVALSSYYAKVFTERTTRTRFDYGKWLVSKLVTKCLDPSDTYIKDAVLSKVVDYKSKVPYVYSTIAAKISSFKINQLELSFDYKHRIEKFGYSDSDLTLEKDGWVLVGRGPNGPLLMDNLGFIYVADKKEIRDLGSLEELAGIDVSQAPTSMAEIKIYSKNIPAGIVLSYLLGFENLLKRLKTKYRIVNSGDRMHLTKDEYAVRFKDVSYVFNRNDSLSTLILSGFNLYHGFIRTYNSASFNNKDVYSAVLEKAGIGSRHLRELDMMNSLFIDPITMDLLKWMKEPITFTGLLVRSVELLLTEYVPSRIEDPDRKVEILERVRGYERFSGMLYESLSKAVRSYSARAASGRANVTVNPTEVMTMIIQDSTVAPVNNINPIHSLREREVITFSGRGGRSRRAMVASSRLFTDEDMGFISEGTVDSGDVGIITYLSPNSNMTSVRGTVRLFDKDKDGAACIMSTASLISPFADGDDQQRSAR